MFSLHSSVKSESVRVWFHRIAIAIALHVVNPWVGGAFAQPQLISINAITPNALVVGSSSPLRISGMYDQYIDRLIFSDSRILAEPILDDPHPGDSVKPNRPGAFQVTVPAEVPPGIYEVHAVGRFGVSNPRAVAVVAPEYQVITSVGNTQDEKLPENTLICGTVQPTTRTNFTIEASENVRYLVCASISLDSSLLPRLRVKNAKGNTIKSARWRDRSPIIVGLPKGFSGEIELADEMYRGGTGFQYILGCFSSLDHPLKYRPDFFPVASLNANGLPEIPVNDLRLGPQNDKSSFEISPPTELLLDRTAGWSFRWEQTAGQVNQVEYWSSSLGHSTDSRLSIFQTSAEPAQNQSDTPKTLLGVHEDSPAIGTNGISFSSFDPSFSVVTSADQPQVHYLLEVDDLQSRSQIFDASSNPVRLRIAPPVPRFQCAAHWSPWTSNPALAGLTGSNLPANGIAAIHVMASRLGGFSGPIQLEVRNLPEGLQAICGTIQPNQSEAFVLIQNSEAGVDWIGLVEILARGTIGETPVEQVVSAATTNVPASTERGGPQSRLASGLWLKASKLDPAPIKIQLKTPGVVEVHAGEKVALPLAATRTPEGLAKCLLRPKYLPPGASIPEIELAAEGAEVTPELAVAKECVPGEYSICFQGDMVWKQAGEVRAHLQQHAAYRDRLIQQKEAAETEQRKAELEALIVAANSTIEQLTRESTPIDRGVQFYTAPVQLKVLPPKE